ncbi:hypothetical protein [Nostoc sphaeroides]|uniref:XRE family transcriptional regulator n=1 Tax=Nostoc sphaeroides CCNUC1 TaxID=2653204 RepID=A0A5P8WFA5_9NOSO|nr:hypothetical protein [Nostoc sphaeroides]QFS51354.1 hypothetical protein GXM_08848 [Nostoc sphaeroides CCNUC1]
MASAGRQKKIMLDTKYVASIYWDKEMGERLKVLRRGRSVRGISEKTAELGERISHQYIHMLEDPERYDNSASTVSFSKISVLLKALDSNIEDFFDTAITIVSVAS